MPELLGDESAQIRYDQRAALLTPDGFPILGETPRSRASGRPPRSGSRRAPHRPRGRRVDDHGNPRSTSVTPTSPGSTRTSAPARTSGAHVRGLQQDLRHRPPGRAVVLGSWQCAWRRCTSRSRRSGRSSSRPLGWERPWWYESNAGLVEKFGDACMPREHEWDSRWWSPIINAEHLQMRETAALVDLSAFAIFDVVGPAALAAVQQVIVAQADVKVGRVVYTWSSTAVVASVPTSPSCGWPTTTSGWSPVARTAWRTRSGSPTGCPRSHGRRRHVGMHDDRDLGTQGGEIPASVTSADVSHAGLPVRDLPRDRGRQPLGPRLADLVCR